MTVKIKNIIEEDEEFEIPILNIIIETNYPSTPIKIYLDEDLFGTNTDDKGIARCGTSTIKDYNIRVEIEDEEYSGELCLD